MPSFIPLKRGVKTAIAFLMGMVVGGAGSFLWISQRLAPAQEFTSLAKRASLEEEAFAQYRTGDPHVALYVLTRALTAQEEHVRVTNTQKSNFWDIGLLNARLANVHSQLGDAEQAALHVQSAIVAFAQFGWQLHNADELWGALELIDNNKLREAVERYGSKD